MSLARFLRLGVLVAVLAAAAPSLEAQKSYSRITRDELMSMVRDEGFGSVETRDDKTFTTKMEGYRVAFFILSEGESVQAYSGRTGTKATLASVNSWNRDKRYSRAYIDDDGDPVLELDLDLAGGVTGERIKDFITTVRMSVSMFASEVK